MRLMTHIKAKRAGCETSSLMYSRAAHLLGLFGVLLLTGACSDPANGDTFGASADAGSDGGGTTACVADPPVPCDKTADCPSGHHCNNAKSPPVCQLLYCATSGSRCDEDELCASGLLCEESRCASSVGASCNNQDPCPGDLSCEMDDRCPGFLTCVEPGTKNSQAPCQCDSECMSGDCSPFDAGAKRCR